MLHSERPIRRLRPVHRIGRPHFDDLGPGESGSARPRRIRRPDIAEPEVRADEVQAWRSLLREEGDPNWTDHREDDELEDGPSSWTLGPDGEEGLSLDLGVPIIEAP